MISGKHRGVYEHGGVLVTLASDSAGGGRHDEPADCRTQPFATHDRLIGVCFVSRANAFDLFVGDDSDHVVAVRVDIVCVLAGEGGPTEKSSGPEVALGLRERHDEIRRIKVVRLAWI